MATVNGNDNPNPDLTGTELADTISGFDGADIINGLGGDDVIDSDTYIVGASPPPNFIIFYAYDDGDADQIDGGDGIDFAKLNFGLTTDNITVSFADPSVKQTLPDGTTVVNVERVDFTGGQGDDTVTAGDYADILNGYRGHDTLNGGGGDDIFVLSYGFALDRGPPYGGEDADSVDGGDGIDLARIDRVGDTIGAVYDFSNPNVPVVLADGSTLIRVERIEMQAGSGTDTITAGDYDDTIKGGLGNDTLVGGDGKDTLRGEGGNDTLNGGDGDDQLEHSFNDGESDDLDGGADIDTALLFYTFAEDNIVANFSNPNQLVTLFDGTTIVNVEKIDYRGGRGEDDITGGAYADKIDGGNGDDELHGGGGDDTLSGDSSTTYADHGDDKLYGDAGDDFLSGGYGNDFLYGGDNDDHLADGRGNDELYGEAGDDTLTYSFETSAAETDKLDGGTGIDLASLYFAGQTASVNYDFADPQLQKTLTGGVTLVSIERVDFTAGSGNDTLRGGIYSDKFFGGSGTDNLFGRGGSDEIHGGGENDFINGDDGDDYLYGDAGDDTIFGGGTDNDKIWGGLGGDIVDGGLGDDEIVGDEEGAGQPQYVDSLKGGGGKDTIRGGGGGDYIFGDYDYVDGNDGPDKYKLGADNDRLFGQGGNDTIHGGGGNDLIEGGDEFDQYGGDYLYGGDGNDTIRGGAGTDVLTGGAGNDTMEGGTGNDYYYVDASSDIVAESVAGGVDRVYSTAYAFTLGSEVEFLLLTATTAYRGTGGNTANYINGNGALNLLEGMGGNDDLYGYGGNDVLKGGTGRDWMYGGIGDDSYYVDAEDVHQGHATIVEDKNAGSDTVYASHSFTLLANFEILRLGGSSKINGVGNDIDNRIYGNGKANTLEGKKGNDTLVGDDGDDDLEGHSGSDFLYGDEGNDTLDGGFGQDELHGGKGADKLYGGKDDERDEFLFTKATDSGKTSSTWDKIYDFDWKNGSEKISDKIDLKDLDLAWGDIDVDTAGSHVKVGIDLKGSSSFEMIIQVMNIADLNKADFLL